MGVNNALKRLVQITIYTSRFNTFSLDGIE
jgi:hypothetical protein